MRFVDHIIFNRFFWGLILLGGVKVHAQTRPVQMEFVRDSIEIQENKSFKNQLIVKNNADHEVTITQIESSKDYPGLLLIAPTELVLEPSQTKHITFKFIATTDLMKSGLDKLEFTLHYSSGHRSFTESVVFTIIRDEPMGILLYPISRTPVISPEEKEKVISVYVENQGYSHKKLQLILADDIPDFEVDYDQFSFELGAQERRQIDLLLIKKSRDLSQENYPINLRVVEPIKQTQDTLNLEREKMKKRENRENTLAYTVINLVNLSNIKQFLPITGRLKTKEFVEMSYMFQDTRTDYFRFKANTSFGIGNNYRAEINLGGDYFLEPQQINLYDTWLAVQREASLFRLGNIQAYDYDYSVSGKGLSYVHSFTEDHKLEVLGLSRNYSLYNNMNYSVKESKIGGVKYDFKQSPNFAGKFSSLYEHNPNLHTETQLNDFRSLFSLDSIHHFQTETGLSYERGQILKDEHFGLHLGLKYKVDLKKWTFFLANSYATPSYAGLNRGNLSLDEQINYKLRKGRIFAQYLNRQIEPRQLRMQNAELIDYRYDYKMFYQSIRLGLQLHLGQWNLMISPQLDEQKNKIWNRRHHIKAARFKTSLGTRFWGDHSFNLTTDYSHIRSESDLENYNGFRSTLSYFFRGFSINATWQYNPYNVNDLNFITEKPFQDYNIYATYTFQALASKMKGSVSLGTGESELYQSKNLNLQAHVEYEFLSHWSANLYGTYTDYTHIQNQFKNDYYQVGFGIKRYLNQRTQSGNYTIRLRFFEDKDFSGSLDGNEIAVANQLIKLNGEMAITDHNGEVIFYNVPKGEYNLSLYSAEGLRMNRHPIIKVEKNLRLEVPMVRKIKLRGRLEERKKSYDRQETNPRGIIVYAKDQQGREFQTLVNQNNKFEFSLDAGIYEVYIKSEQFHFLEASQIVDLNKRDEDTLLIFEYEKKNLDIKVKQF